MEILKVWMCLLSVSAALVAGCWLCMYIERKFPGERYDERQKTARGKAYRFGFWVGIAYFLIVWLFIATEDKVARYGSTLVLAGVLLQLLAGLSYMTVTGSVLPLSYNPKYLPLLSVLDFLLGLVWLRNAYKSVALEQAIFNQSSMPWNDLIISVTWISVAVLYLISWLTKARDE